MGQQGFANVDLTRTEFVVLGLLVALDQSGQSFNLGTTLQFLSRLGVISVPLGLGSLEHVFIGWVLKTKSIKRLQ